MDLNIIIIVILLAVAVASIILFLNKKIAGLKQDLNEPKDERSILMLQQQVSQLSEALDKKLSEANQLSRQQIKESGDFMGGISKESRELLSEVSKQFNEMSQHSQRSIREVTERLTKLDETNKQVVGFSEQLKNLQDILKNPKQRGVLGEYYLEETLKNVLPPNAYKMQYGFKNGEIVDAVVFVDKKIIPIDSKFSLENYERLLNSNDKEERKKIAKSFKEDLKKRIDETAKYIRPEENTVDFSFMFIPSESIYYDLLVGRVGSVNSRNLIEYAFKDKHVIIVSPTSFLAYLQTVLQGLRALEIEESAKEIQKNVEKLGKHLQSYEVFHEKLGNSLSTTVNHYKKSFKELGKIDKDVTKITGGEKKLKLKEVEINNPKDEE